MLCGTKCLLLMQSVLHGESNRGQASPRTKINACANRKKQCRPNETKPYSNATHPRKRQNDPTNGHTPSRIKSMHTRLT